MDEKRRGTDAMCDEEAYDQKARCGDDSALCILLANEEKCQRVQFDIFWRAQRRG